MWRALFDLIRYTSTRKLIASVATIKSMDVILPIERAGEHFELRLRTVAKPDKEVAQLLVRLGLQLPRQSKIIENVVPKMNWKLM